jgi:hypothetical protein
MHKTCYERADCIGSPAPLWGWKLVNNVTIPSDRLMKWSIDYFGPCSGVRGQFEPSITRFKPSMYPSILNTKSTTVWDRVSLLPKTDVAPKYRLLDVNSTKSIGGATTPRLTVPKSKLTVPKSK